MNDDEILLEMVKAQMRREREMAMQQAQFREYSIRRVPPPAPAPEPEDPDLRRLKASDFHTLAGDRLRAYGINVSGESANVALMTLIGLLFAEIDDLRAIIEGGNG